MLRRFLLTLAVLVLVPVVCTTAAPEQSDLSTGITVKKISQALVIDGELRDWGTTEPIELSSEKLVRGSRWNGPADLSARIWLAWDQQHLYFAADIVDDDFTGLADRQQIWNSDCLILSLRFPQTDPSGTSYFLMVSSRGAEPEVRTLTGSGNRFSNYPVSTLEVAAEPREGMAPLFEGSIAWSDFIGPEAKTPDRMELNLEVRDRDAAGGLKSITWISSGAASGGRSGFGLAVLLDTLGYNMDAGESSFNVDQVEFIRLVQIPVVVTDGDNEYVRELDKDDFEIFEDGVPQAIDDFKYESRPITAGLLIDSSGSMQPHIEGAKEAAVSFLEAMREEDRAFVISFNHNIEDLKDIDGDMQEAVEAIRKIEANGGTALYDTLLYALDKLLYIREKKVLVLLSDGKDESQGLENPFGINADIGLILEEARRKEVAIYAIAYRLIDVTSINDLTRLTLETGGRIYRPENIESLIDAYEAVGEDLKSQYLISYVSNNRTFDGRWRAIEVRIKNRDYTVRTRKGYYAPQR